MIFLSHNYKDKVVVEQFAIELAKEFGKEKIFYDSWSIQPGDGIIDKMNAGLGAADLFFFFVSINSLESRMVDLEWQNGVMKASHGNMRLIPVRLDASLIPPILMQNVYLDFFNQGLETTLRQVIELAKGNETFTRQFANFSNLRAIVEVSGSFEKLVTIEALHFNEPRTRVMFLLDEIIAENEVEVATGSGMFEGGFITGIMLSDGSRCNAATIGSSSSLAVESPFRVKITWAGGRPPELKGVIHLKSEKQWDPVQMLKISHNSIC